MNNIIILCSDKDFQLSEEAVERPKPMVGNEGVPVIRVGRSNGLNFDHADFIENNPYDFKAQTVEQVSTSICKLFLLDDEEKLRILNYGRQFVKESFTLVNENTLQSFISIN